MNKKIESNPKQYGKSTLVLNSFIAACKAGERVILQGPDYVAMDRKSYEELVKKAEGVVTISGIEEEVELTDEQIKWVNEKLKEPANSRR
jgi:hypothetical protein